MRIQAITRLKKLKLCEKYINLCPRRIIYQLKRQGDWATGRLGDG